ncbi:hypothetical protein Q4506_06625 [Colwellia sp. 4_MG-2023]|uniref:hypothetical protein n=1 Tax=unclassified Colwellia TaxID=196834 RepID=UPI001C0A32BD|nr:MULTISPECIES: hypothetical protein [unclassified Colwellia]MBU2925842.1 hypothetical protein [Colwellia sp. C2M11]MDO6508204.1 hypothetical protein [Colwellia sp. 5_MG-2023]MDO6555347.1 hypothetical protein [Colwellia sp. 4_MG-2023]MDO6652761.1 hypothetical protein [Colwellia sp. 3_MG-2023]MDO6665635.1 hypothetical protein [Colwellia sp. 2_MG-2023]
MMSKFLNLVALLPILSFIVTMIFILITKEEIYTNYHWFVVALLSLQSSAERVKNASSVSITIFVSGILANILLIIATAFDLKIPPITLVLFMGYLSTGFLILFGDIAVKWYKKLDSQQGKSVVK